MAPAATAALTPVLASIVFHRTWGLQAAVAHGTPRTSPALANAFNSTSRSLDEAHRSERQCHHRCGVKEVLEKTALGPIFWQVRKDGHPRYMLVHIPKVAGFSWIMDVFNEYLEPPGSGFYVSEKTYPVMQAYGGGRIYAMFREPRAHVLSQFMECRYTKWGQRVSHKPGRFENISVWLHHFGKERHTGGTDDMGCYNPENMQSRALSSDGVNSMHHIVDGARPDETKSLAALRDLWMVGILEHYQASVCLFIAKARGEVPDWCDCTGTAWNSFHMQAFSHDVPPHSVSDLSASDVEMIDALTDQDQAVYAEAVQLFREQVWAEEGRLQVKILCED
mmetsp:Transcript_106899/g.300568  ORF Transcript_106899/g.300568 Transcript_106899/m.300568 type:complete len:336 (-) Transcript_106899:166-1173(-)